MVGGEDNKCKVPLKSTYVAVTFLGFSLTLILFQFKWCNPKDYENGEE